jgi:hypothetical protein
MDVEAAREHLLSARRPTVEATLACADHVAGSWEGRETTDRGAVVEPFERLLERSELLERYPTVLAECVSAAGGTLRASPVALPPYVVVTSRGVVLRATLDGGRLVAAVEAFSLDRSGGTNRYVRGASDPESAVSVEWRAAP